MRAAVVTTPGTIAVHELPDPTPGPGEIVVAPRAVGICGTDLHIIDGEFPPAPYPLVPGHEFAGEVVALGAGVTGLSIGERVAVDPSLFCGHCTYCQRQRGNLCEDWGATGDTVDGAFAELVAVPAGNAYAIPDSLSWGAAALNTFEPAMRLMAAGAIDAETMITHTLPLEQFADAVQLVRDRQGLKVQVDPAL